MGTVRNVERRRGGFHTSLRHYNIVDPILLGQVYFVMRLSYNLAFGALRSLTWFRGGYKVFMDEPCVPSLLRGRVDVPFQR